MVLRLIINKKILVYVVCLFFLSVQFYLFGGAIFGDKALPLTEQEKIEINAYVSSFYEFLMKSPSKDVEDIKKWFYYKNIGNYIYLNYRSPLYEVFGVDWGDVDDIEFITLFLETYGELQSIEMVHSVYLESTYDITVSVYMIDYKVRYEKAIIYDRVFVTKANGKYEIYRFFFDDNSPLR